MPQCRDIWSQKTRILWLLEGNNRLTTCLARKISAISAESALWTDRRTATI